jgi:hypothetical protein
MFYIYIVRDFNAACCLVSASLVIFPVGGCLLLLRRGLRDIHAGLFSKLIALAFLISLALVVLYSFSPSIEQNTGVKGVFQGYSTLTPMSGICRIDHVPSL